MNHSYLQIFTNCSKGIREYNLCCQRYVTVSSSPEKQRKLSRLFAGLWTTASKYFQYPIPQRKNPLGCKCIQIRAMPSLCSSIQYKLETEEPNPKPLPCCTFYKCENLHSDPIHAPSSIKLRDQLMNVFIQCERQHPHNRHQCICPPMDSWDRKLCRSLSAVGICKRAFIHLKSALAFKPCQARLLMKSKG